MGKGYPFLALVSVVKQKQSCKISADCTHTVLQSKTQPANFELCEYLVYIFSVPRRAGFPLDMGPNYERF